MERAIGTGRTFSATSVHPAAATAAAVNGRSRTLPTSAPMAASPSIPRPSLSFLLLLLLLSSAPNGLEGAGGFRLCGLKLTMMLNAICKQQLCGGFVLKKKRSSLQSLPLNMANFASLSTDGGQLEGEQSTALLRHNLLSMNDGVWVNNPTPLEELSWAKRSSYPYKEWHRNGVLLKEMHITLHENILLCNINGRHRQRQERRELGRTERRDNERTN
ncbi:hypothetical protein GPALN_011187 [Globodera pallida]|nr:hypothetical protein GPALN_011187 [Globodera pallida]